MDYKKLKLAVAAGANSISSNKKLCGSTFCVYDDTNGKVVNKHELSYYHAEIILLLFSQCIYEDGINFDELSEYIHNIDKYEIKR